MLHNSEQMSPPSRCLFAAELRMADGQKCFLHSHACTELIWYRGCCGWLPQGGVRLRYVAGDVAVYQPGVLHGDECEKRGTQVCVGVAGAGAAELPAGVWHADADSRAAYELVRRELNRHSEQRPSRLDLLSGWLVMELGRQWAGQAPATQREPIHVATARRIFDTRFAESLSIAGVAAELGINPDYLRQLFIKATGESPVRYLIRKRLEVACDLLRLNQESTHQIAARVGIDNPYYFSRLFRQRFDVTPTQYRTRYATAQRVRSRTKTGQ